MAPISRDSLHAAYHSIRDLMREIASHFPAEIERTARRAKDAARDLAGGNSVLANLLHLYRAD